MKHLQLLKYDVSKREYDFKTGRIVFIYEEKTNTDGYLHTSFCNFCGVLGIKNDHLDDIDYLYLTEKRWFTESESDYLLGKEIVIFDDKLELSQKSKIINFMV